jgi:D-lactate dehydrogenase
MTLTPRQRITVHREIKSLLVTGDEPHIAASLLKAYSYAGDETCATDGLCAVSCPVKIDTGKLIKSLRTEKIGSNHRTAMWIADNMNRVTSAMRVALTTVSFFHSILGTAVMKSVSGVIRKISFNSIPEWNEYMPSGSSRIKSVSSPGKENMVVYFPSCINRAMGVSREYSKEKQLSEKIVQLIEKAGHTVIYPDNMNKLCCGMAFSSKGYTKAGEKKSKELESELLKASNNGQYPVLCDMSPCLYTMKENMKSGLKLYEPVQFILEYLVPNLKISPVDETVTVFPVCSMKKMGLDGRLTELAGLCAKEVIVADTNCCGFAGDRGFTYPELNRHGLGTLRSQIPEDVVHGYSTSRTCEIGLSLHTGISHKSIVYLVDKASTPKKV